MPWGALFSYMFSDKIRDYHQNCWDYHQNTDSTRKSWDTKPIKHGSEWGFQRQNHVGITKPTMTKSNDMAM